MRTTIIETSDGGPKTRNANGNRTRFASRRVARYPAPGAGERYAGTERARAREAKERLRESAFERPALP